MSFRKNLEYLRKGKKLSQEELADKLGVSRQSVSKWESGAAYPETEKMLTMCKIFDCSLDQLMNDDIAEAEKSEAKKYSFNDLLAEVTDVIKGTIEMLTSMSAKSIVRFLFELAFLFLLIILLRVPFEYINRIGLSFFHSFGLRAGNVLAGFWEFIIEIVYLVVAVVSFVYIYKIRFLDKFREMKKTVGETKADIVVKEIVEEERVLKRIEVKKYDFGVFALIGKIALFFTKCFAFFLSLPLIFLLLCASAGVLVGIVWMFSGVFYIGVVIFLLSFILFAVALLQAIYNFIVNHRTNWQKLFIAFVVSIIGFGIGVGITALDFSKMTIEDVPSRVVVDTKTEVIQMSDNLIPFILGTGFYRDSYVVDNTLTDSVKVEVKYYSAFTNPIISISELDGDREINVYNSARQMRLGSIYKIFLDDLKNKSIANYARLTGFETKIYSSEDNIEKMKKNLNDSYQRTVVQPSEIEVQPEVIEL